MRTDTVLIPRVVVTSPPLAPRPRRRRRVAGAVLVLAVIAAGVVLAVITGRAVAYRDPAAPVGEQQHGGVVELELPVYPDGLGTDAGLVTTPAGDL